MNFFKRLFGSKKPADNPKPVQDVYNPSAFSLFVQDHMPHQNITLEKTVKHPMGQISIPTGCGKTRIQLHLHLKDMLDKQANNQTGIYVIVAHRLALCNQLLADFSYLTASKLNIQCDYLIVSSDSFSVGRIVNTIKKRYPGTTNKDLSILKNDGTRVLSTTDENQITEFIKVSKNLNRHVVCVSTYNSFDRLKKVKPLDVCTFDEAHKIGKQDKDFYDGIAKVKPNIAKQYFFTATRKVEGSKGGMNDTGFYGEILHTISPMEMVNAGVIVAPQYHNLEIEDYDGQNYDNPLMIEKAIIKGFLDHQNKVKQSSHNPKLIGTKMLVSCDSTIQLRKIVKSISFQEFCKENGIKLFAVSSNPDVGDSINGAKINSRNDILNQMFDLDETDDAILLHVDIFSEGIDLPSLTGVMILRKTISEETLIQTVGRGTRLHPNDRQRIKQGKLKPKVFSKYVKAQCWIIIPNFVTDEPFIKQTLNNTFGVPHAPLINYSRDNEYLAEANNEPEPLNPFDDLEAKNREGKLASYYDINSYWSTLSSDEQMKFLNDVILLSADTPSIYEDKNAQA